MKSTTTKGLSKKANQNRDIIEGIRHRMNAGAITYEQAQVEAKPTIDEMNKRAKEIADEFGMKYRPFSFKSLMR